MTWVWLSATVVLIGAEVNAEMEHQTERDTTIGPEKAPGTRGATNLLDEAHARAAEKRLLNQRKALSKPAPIMPITERHPPTPHQHRTFRPEEAGRLRQLRAMSLASREPRARARAGKRLYSAGSETTGMRTKTTRIGNGAGWGGPANGPGCPFSAGHGWGGPARGTSRSRKAPLYEPGNRGSIGHNGPEWERLAAERERVELDPLAFSCKPFPIRSVVPDGGAVAWHERGCLPATRRASRRTAPTVACRDRTPGAVCWAAQSCTIANSRRSCAHAGGLQLG